MENKRQISIDRDEKTSESSLIWRSVSKLIDWFIPEKILSGERTHLARSRLIVTFAITILVLAAIYAAIFFAMHSTLGGFTLVYATVGVFVSVLLLRLTGSLNVAANSVILNYFAVLTMLACCLGGHGGPSFPWLTVVPAIALCTLGKRAAWLWLIPVLVSTITFYGMDLAGIPVLLDVAPHHLDFLWLVSIIGLTILVLCTAAHHEATKRDLERSRIDAEAASRAKSEFLANMSHEIRTPMTAVLGFSDILMSTTADKEQLESLTIIKRNGEYLIGVINDILDLSKIEAGKLEVERLQVSVQETVNDVASLMRVRADAKGLHLKIHYEGLTPEHLPTDPIRLRQILVNLVGNAIKFTEVGGVSLTTRIVGASSMDPKIEFEVLDTGIGISSQQMEILFQPFNQADYSTTRKFGGTGLGLAISDRLAQKLGGELSVSSTQGEGSSFTLRLSIGPLDQTKLINCSEQHTPETTAERTISKDRSELSARVLLAEDGIDNQRLVSFVLKKAGAEVVIADNGKIAFDLALREQEKGRGFDVILMDMQMPVMDGYSATRALREAGYSRPIIALTAHAMNDDRAKCVNAGCDDYATKPINRAELIALVDRYHSESLGAMA